MRNRFSSPAGALLAAATLHVQDAACPDSDTGKGKPRTDAAQAATSTVSRISPSSCSIEHLAYAGRLAKLLVAGHPDKVGELRVPLDGDRLQRIVVWLDLNAVCCSTKTRGGGPRDLVPGRGDER